MENVFVPIDARTDPRYLYVKNNPLYKDFFEGFFDYQTDLSFKAGKVNKSSGKAQSYRNHLMKIIVFTRKFTDHIQLAWNQRKQLQELKLFQNE